MLKFRKSRSHSIVNVRKPDIFPGKVCTNKIMHNFDISNDGLHTYTPHTHIYYLNITFDTEFTQNLFHDLPLT